MRNHIIFEKGEMDFRIILEQIKFFVRSWTTNRVHGEKANKDLLQSVRQSAEKRITGDLGLLISHQTGSSRSVWCYVLNT